MAFENQSISKFAQKIEISYRSIFPQLIKPSLIMQCGHLKVARF